MTAGFAAAAWLAGMAAASNLGGAAVAGAAIAIGITLAAVHVRAPGRRLALAAAIFAALALLGAWRYESGLPHPERSGLARLNDGAAVTVRAVVAAPPEERGATMQLRLNARSVVVDGQARPLDGKLLAIVPPEPRYRYGDVLELRGRPQTPPSFEGFDYREYLARQGIGSRMTLPRVERLGHDGASGPVEALRTRLFELRAYLAGRLARELPEPEAGLAQGMALGERRAIDPALREDLNATGTSHLVVISGQNVAILAALLTTGLAWLIGRRQAGVAALVVVAAYTAMAGAEPPVVRGALMGGAWTVATLLGRRASAPVALALAAALMTAQRPAIIDDVSFQLSVAATAGLVFLTRPLAVWGRAWLGIPDAPPGLASATVDAAAVTTAATLATLPIVALNFGRVALITLPANLALVPLFPLILALSSATALLGGLWAPLGTAIAPFAWLALTAMVRLVRAFAAVPFASAQVDGVATWHAVAAYVALGALAWWLHRRKPVLSEAEGPATAGGARPSRFLAAGRKDAYAALAGVTAALVAFAAFDARPGGPFAWIPLNHEALFEVRFLDVGQGDAALLRSPHGRTVLIDGGADGQRLARELGEALPARDRSLDMVVVTHADADHATGLVELLRRFEVGVVLAPEYGDGTPFAALLAEARERGAPVRIGRAGQRFDFDGATIEVLAPTDGLLGSENNAGLALRFRYGSAGVLFAADLESGGEARLARAFPNAEVLKVAHHGSRTSSTPLFLEAVRPAVAVVSVGERNAYGHPHPEVMARLEAATERVYRTDRDGTVRVTTDGRRIWVRSGRNPD